MTLVSGSKNNNNNIDNDLYVFPFSDTRHTATNKRDSTPSGASAKTRARLPSRAATRILPRRNRIRRPRRRSGFWACSSSWCVSSSPCCSRENSSLENGCGAVAMVRGRACASCGRCSSGCFRRGCWGRSMGVNPTSRFISPCVLFGSFFFFCSLSLSGLLCCVCWGRYRELAAPALCRVQG